MTGLPTAPTLESVEQKLEGKIPPNVPDACRSQDTSPQSASAFGREGVRRGTQGIGAYSTRPPSLPGGWKWAKSPGGGGGGRGVELGHPVAGGKRTGLWMGYAQGRPSWRPQPSGGAVGQALGDRIGDWLRWW